MQPSPKAEPRWSCRHKAGGSFNTPITGLAFFVNVVVDAQTKNTRKKLEIAGFNGFQIFRNIFE